MNSGRSSVGLLVLLALAVLAALIGVPEVFRSRGPIGALTGLVVDPRGYGVARTPVYLFGDDLRLVERTLTDEQGRFALQDVPARYHVLARPEADRELAPRWRLDGVLDGARLDFVLPGTRPRDLVVVDADGRAVPAAEVRVYERGFEAAILATTVTDARGVAALALPPRSDVAVRIPGPVEHWVWRFDVTAEASGPRRIEVRLDPTRTIRGHLSCEGQPAEGLWVQAGPLADAGWFGFVRSDPAGAFALEVPAATAVELRVLDPGHRALPERLVLTGPAPLDIELDPGQPLEVTIDTRKADPVMRVWAWNPVSQAWGWGQSTDPGGRAAIRAGRRFGVHVEPRAPGHEGLTLWDLEYRSPFLHLNADPGRP